MEAIAHAKFQRFGVNKVGQVLNLIRGKSVEAVERLLPLINRRPAVLVTKTLKSAVSNFQVKSGKKVDSAQLYLTATWACQGPMGQMKRVKPAPMGRAMTFKRKVCHLTMVVSDQKTSGKGK